MSSKKILLTNGIVVTMNDAREIFHDACVEIQDGLIHRVAPSQCFDLAAPDTECVDLRGHLILPGLIDCAGFAGKTMCRGLLTERNGGAMAVPGTVPDILKNGTFWADDAVSFAVERTRRGVTTGVVIFPDDAALSTEYTNAYIDAYRKTGAGLFAVCALSSKANAADALYIAPSDLTDAAEQVSNAARSAAQLRKKLFVGTRGGLVDLLESRLPEIRAAELVFLHCNGMTYREARIIANEGWSVVHTPAHTSRYAPFAELWSLGVRPAISPHNMVFYANTDMLQAVRRAQMIEQLRMDDLNYLPVGTQLEAITIHAAQVLGMGDAVGSVEPGKRADLITVDLNRPHLVPWKTMPLHRFMMDGNANDIDNVMIGGRFIMRNRCIEMSNARRATLYEDGETIGLCDRPDFGKAYRVHGGENANG